MSHDDKNDTHRPARFKPRRMTHNDYKKYETNSTTYIVEDDDGGLGATISRWIELNPDWVGPGKAFKNRAAVERWFFDNNDLSRTLKGERCDGVDVKGVFLPTGGALRTPGGEPIDGVNAEKVCGPKKPGKPRDCDEAPRPPRRRPEPVREEPEERIEIPHAREVIRRREEFDLPAAPPPPPIVVTDRVYRQPPARPPQVIRRREELDLPAAPPPPPIVVTDRVYRQPPAPAPEVVHKTEVINLPAPPAPPPIVVTHKVYRQPPAPAPEVIHKTEVIEAPTQPQQPPRKSPTMQPIPDDDDDKAPRRPTPPPAPPKDEKPVPPPAPKPPVVDDKQPVPPAPPAPKPQPPVDDKQPVPPAPPVDDKTPRPGFGPVEYFSYATHAADGRYWRRGDLLHAFETYARSGLNPKFTYEWYALKNVAAREPVIKERDSGQTGTTPQNTNMKMEGRNRILGFLGDSNQSRPDDASAKMDNDNGAGLVYDWTQGRRQRAFVAGHSDVTPDGHYERRDSMNGPEFAYGGNYATDYLGGINIGQVLPFLSLPVGVVWSSPRSQQPMDAEVSRWGIAQSTAALASVNFGGLNGLFRDTQAQMTDQLMPFNWIGAKLYADNAAAELVNSLKAFETSRRYEDALKALVAWRDLGENALIKQNEALRIPMEKERDGLLNYFKSQGLDVNKLRADMEKAPRLEPQTMSQKQLEDQQGYWMLKGSRYAGIVPDSKGTNFRVYEQDAYRTMNRFEYERARGADAKLDEKNMIGRSRQAAEMLMGSDGALRAIGTALRSDLGLQTNLGEALTSIARNYEFYGFKTRDDAEKYLKQFVGGDSTAKNEVISKDGATAFGLGGSIPIPFLSDTPYAMQNPEHVGRVIGPVIEKNPALLRDLLDRITNPALGMKDGKSDGRRYGIALLQAIGSQPLPKTAQEGDVPPLAAAIVAQLPAAQRQEFLKAVLDGANYAENGLAGVSGRARTGLTNRFAAAQAAADGRSFDAGYFDVDKVRAAVKAGDVAWLYNELFDSAEAKEAGADQARVLGLQANPAVAQDAILLTLLSDPHALDGVIRSLEKRGDPVQFERYSVLKRMLERVRDRAEKGDIEGAVQRYAEFITDMSALRDGSSASFWHADNKGGLRYNAWNAMLEFAGNDVRAREAIIKAIKLDPELRNGMMRTTPDAATGLTNVRVSNNAVDVPKVLDNDNGKYHSRYYKIPLNSKGEARDGGLLGPIFGPADADVLWQNIPASVQGKRPKGAAAPAAGASAEGWRLATPQEIAAATKQNAGESDAAYQARLNKAFNSGMMVPAGGGAPVLPGAGAAAASGQSQLAALNKDLDMLSALGVAPVIYTGPNGDATQILASMLASGAVKAGKNIPASDLNAAAAAIIAANGVKVNASGSDMVLAVDSAGLKAALAAGGNLDAAAGVALVWATAFLIHTGGGDKKLPFTSPPTCCDPPTPLPSPTPPLIPFPTI